VVRDGVTEGRLGRASAENERTREIKSETAAWTWECRERE
jgi:hypothetical protein